MIDHVTANVGDVERAKQFYSQALAPLGYSLQAEFPGQPASAAARAAPTSGSAHTRNAARRTSRSPRRTARPWTRSTRLRWRQAARTTAAPGLRPHYHETYYAAYVHDADGNNIEAVTHRPE